MSNDEKPHKAQLLQLYPEQEGQFNAIHAKINKLYREVATLKARIEILEEKCQT